MDTIEKAWLELTWEAFKRLETKDLYRGRLYEGWVDGQWCLTQVFDSIHKPVFPDGNLPNCSGLILRLVIVNFLEETVRSEMEHFCKNHPLGVKDWNKK